MRCMQEQTNHAVHARADKPNFGFHARQSPQTNAHTSFKSSPPLHKLPSLVGVSRKHGFLHERKVFSCSSRHRQNGAASTTS